MRAVHLLAASAALVGVSFASVGQALAQGIVEMAPPADSSRVSQPRPEDVKFESDTAQPPKVGSAIFPGRGMMEVLTSRKKARRSAAGTGAK